jgi:hypothetical protein
MEKFARPGGPGARFKTHLDKLFKCLSLPKGAREELGLAGDEPLYYNEEEEDRLAKERKEKMAGEEPDLEKDAEYERARHLRKMNAALFGDGFFHLIPSFYRMLMFLKKNKREFAIAFRTFGSDTDNLVYEWNTFCAGEHPAFNGRNGTPNVRFDGSKNCKELSISEPSQRGMMYRNDSEDICDAVMVTGPHERVVSELSVGVILLLGIND